MINFHKISHHISLWILTVGKDNHMLRNILFVTYATIFRCLSDFTYVKTIKDYSLTWQRKYSTYSRRRAQCRTPQDFRLTLKKIEKNTTPWKAYEYRKIRSRNNSVFWLFSRSILIKDYSEKTDIFTYTKRHKYSALNYRKDAPSLSVHL